VDTIQRVIPVVGGTGKSGRCATFGSELEKRAKLIDKTNQRPITFF
jgi:hypothetical protein